MSQIKLGDTDIPFVFRGDEMMYPNYIKDGLVLHYDFSGMTNTDTSRGIATDLSGNGNHGTLLNFNYTAESGYDKNKLLFDGVDDYVSASGQPLSDLTILLSIEVSGTNDQFFFGGDVNAFYLRKYMGSMLHGSISADSQITISHQGAFSEIGDIEKHSVGLIINNQNQTVGLIQNGVTVTEISFDGESSPFRLTRLGRWTNSSNGMSDFMMSAQVYNRPLTPEEIAHNYAIEKERFGIE